MKIRENDIDDLRVFLDHYEREALIDLNKVKKKIFWRRGQDVTCRFCLRTGDELTFQNQAHFIPKALGNRYLLSAFECDQCNIFFGRYENDLANFLGPYRSIAKITGKSRSPTFKASDGSIEISEGPTQEIIIKHLKDSNPSYADLNDGATINKFFSTKKNAYRPINAFKSLLKAAMGMIPDEDLEFFDRTFEFLRSNHEGQDLKRDSFKVICYFIPGPVLLDKPILELYKRRKSKYNFPERLVVYHIKNIKFYMIIPFNKQDYHLTNQVVNMPRYPILMEQEHYSKFGDYYCRSIDLSNTNLVKGEVSSFNLTFENITIKQGEHKNN